MKISESREINPLLAAQAIDVKNGFGFISL